MSQILLTPAERVASLRSSPVCAGARVDRIQHGWRCFAALSRPTTFTVQPGGHARHLLLRLLLLGRQCADSFCGFHCIYRSPFLAYSDETKVDDSRGRHFGTDWRRHLHAAHRAIWLSVNKHSTARPR